MRALLIVGGGLRGGGGVADNTWGFVEQNTVVASKGCWDERFSFLFFFFLGMALCRNGIRTDKVVVTTSFTPPTPFVNINSARKLQKRQ